MDQGDGNATRSGADIGCQPAGGIGAQPLQRPFHQQFGLRAGDQSILGDGEIQAEEGLPSEQVRQGFTGFHPLQSQGQRQSLFGRELRFRMGHDPGP